MSSSLLNWNSLWLFLTCKYNKQKNRCITEIS